MANLTVSREKDITVAACSCRAAIAATRVVTMDRNVSPWPWILKLGLVNIPENIRK